MDNRLTSEIINRKFKFKGTLPYPERAEIAFDNEFDKKRIGPNKSNPSMDKSSLFGQELLNIMINLPNP